MTEEVSPVMDNSDDSLVRHSEFYKSSTSVMRRPSSESQLSFQASRERGGSTLSDLIKRESGDNDVSSKCMMDNVLKLYQWETILHRRSVRTHRSLFFVSRVPVVQWEKTIFLRCSVASVPYLSSVIMG